MKTKSTSYLVGAGLLIAACSTLPQSNLPTGEEKIQPFAKHKTSFLTQEEAILRSKQVAHPTYNLWFGFDDKSMEYDGRTVINFDLRPKGKDLSKTLFIDFEAGTLRSLTVNGAPQAVPQYDGHRIVLRTQDLLPGANRVELAYTNAYSKDGNGLHRFEDPVDHHVYLYSHFEPDYAHQMFPCFDQPDLKASFELTVEAPTHWQVISNTLEREVNPIDGRESWAFPPSPLFSTYVFGLHAGPYRVWKSNANGIPLRLLTRDSLAPFVDADKWFEVTTQGIEYFNLFFGYPFPYSKYDQIVVPEFNAGGMENAAAVTLTERSLFRSKPTQDQLRNRANLIFHEMAHMWFGDLVTMKWWNGLWLNESFASYMASRAVDQATTFKGGPQSFFGGPKSWAYSEDQLITTHPIEVSVSDTEAATAQFDAITYGKGASVLKQLSYYLGEDDFKEGIQRYFQKYAFKNTSLHDFFKMLGEASGKDLTAWQKAWVQTAGVNTLQAKWSCKEGEKGREIEKFTLLQGNGEDQPPLLRPHRTLVALYGYPKTHGKKSQASQPLQLTESVNATYTGAETSVDEFLGKPCPIFVFPNHQDFDYVKVILDPMSLEVIQKEAIQKGPMRIHPLQDSFARQMVWESLWQMVLDGKYPPQDFATLVLELGAKETDTQLLAMLLKALIQSSPAEPSVYKFLPATMRAELRPKVEAFFRKNLLLAPAGSDLQQEWYFAFLRAASNTESLEMIQKLLTGKTKLRGFTIDQQHRWQLLRTLARNTYPELKAIRDLIDQERKTDPSDTGREEAISCEASIPDSENKKVWLATILRTSDDSFPLAKLKKAMGSFHLLGREDLSRLSVDSYFEMVPKLIDPAAHEFAATFTGSMFPSLCDEEIVKRTSALLNAHSELPMSIAKKLKMRRQREEQCLHVRLKALETPPEIR